MKYSLIIPVYNRPDEVDELLDSLTRQTLHDFEVVVVEDGSAVPCRQVVDAYRERLSIQYHVKENGGPGRARNYGAERAEGEWLIVLDSDVVLPDTYLEEVEQELTLQDCDAWGGPDRAHESFTPKQKAINYSMTGFFTTGGIRGGNDEQGGGKALDRFFPRSFNMGIRRELYLQLQGFSDMRFGEDIDFSYRTVESGARCRLFPRAWVWHKRRTNWTRFYRQVHNSGIARINLTKRHPGTLKLVHLAPAVFTLGVAGLLLLAVVLTVLAALGKVGWLWPLLCLVPLLLFSLLILVDSTSRNRSFRIGMLSIVASYIQLGGYGMGFLQAWWLRCVCGRNEELQAFRNTFYK